MGKGHFNCNNYIQVPKGSDYDAKLTLFELGDGTTPPVLYLRSKKKKLAVKIEDVKVKKVEWNPTIFIDPKCPADEYIELVDWWFENASKDDGYKKELKRKFKKLNDLESHLASCEYWLKSTSAYTVTSTGAWENRKTNINATIGWWLRKNLREQK